MIHKLEVKINIYLDAYLFIKCFVRNNLIGMVSLKDIAPDKIISFSYSPNRIVKMKSLGNSNFIVTESINSKLQKGDIATAYQIAKKHPFEIVAIMRDGQQMGSFTAGIHDGITEFHIS